MADQDANGYNDEASDFKRKHNKPPQDQEQDMDDDRETQQQSQKAQEYIKGMMTERQSLDRKYPIADRLLEVGKCCAGRGRESSCFGFLGADYDTVFRKTVIMRFQQLCAKLKKNSIKRISRNY